MIHFGIITPTYKRTRFLPPFIRNVQRQSYSEWTLALIHDGPDEKETAEVVRRSAQGDVRIKYWETSVHSGTWGHKTRCFGIQRLAESMPTSQYILSWDDDDQFYPEALANINRAIDETGYPDLLLVPIKHKWRNKLPVPGIPPRSNTPGNICNMNLCVKIETALKYHEKSLRLENPYHQDFYYYRSICDDPSTKVCLANISNIGCVDGLRFWATLRWTVWPRPLNVYDTTFMRQLRRLMPRG